jgi:rhamnose transport system permease protein
MSTQTAQPETPNSEPLDRKNTVRRRFANRLGVWEIALIVLVVAAFIAATIATPFFATGQNFAITAGGAVGLALMVVPMALLMISGEIDLSIASVFGLAGVVFGLCVEAGIPLAVALMLGLVLGCAAGLLNGWLTVTFGLPSLVVTVGTLGLYRGIAYILLESRSISALPPEFTTFAQANIYGTYLPYTFLVFVVIAAVAAIVLHRGSFGRKTFAVGSSPVVSRFSGIRDRQVKTILFTFSGAIAALAGMLYAGYVSSARANNGAGLELSVIAIVLIGGVSMFGGKGSFLGVMLSLVLVTVLTSWMNLGFVPTNVQNTVVGLLMIAAVVIPVLATRFKDRRGSSA